MAQRSYVQSQRGLRAILAASFVFATLALVAPTVASAAEGSIEGGSAHDGGEISVENLSATLADCAPADSYAPATYCGAAAGYVDESETKTCPGSFARFASLPALTLWDSDFVTTPATIQSGPRSLPTFRTRATGGYFRICLYAKYRSGESGPVTSALIASERVGGPHRNPFFDLAKCQAARSGSAAARRQLERAKRRLAQALRDRARPGTIKLRRETVRAKRKALADDLEEQSRFCSATLPTRSG